MIYQLYIIQLYIIDQLYIIQQINYSFKYFLVKRTISHVRKYFFVFLFYFVSFFFYR